VWWQSQLWNLSVKQIKTKKTGVGAAQIVEYLPSKHNALSLIPISAKKKNQENKMYIIIINITSPSYDAIPYSL
jgi:hypothetical protein